MNILMISRISELTAQERYIPRKIVYLILLMFSFHKLGESIKVSTMNNGIFVQHIFQATDLYWKPCIAYIGWSKLCVKIWELLVACPAAHLSVCKFNAQFAHCAIKPDQNHNWSKKNVQYKFDWIMRQEVNDEGIYKFSFVTQVCFDDYLHWLQSFSCNVIM